MLSHLCDKEGGGGKVPCSAGVEKASDRVVQRGKTHMGKVCGSRGGGSARGRDPPEKCWKGRVAASQRGGDGRSLDRVGKGGKRKRTRNDRKACHIETFLRGVRGGTAVKVQKKKEREEWGNPSLAILRL